MVSFSFFPSEEVEEHGESSEPKLENPSVDDVNKKEAREDDGDSDEQAGLAHDLSNDNNSIITDFLMILTDPKVFDCTICTRPLTDNFVYQCVNGHIACSSCRFKQCSSCSKSVSIRCLAIENVMKSGKLRCKHARFGCKETIFYNQRIIHEKDCIYGPCICPITDCNFQGTSEVLSLHFAGEHSSSAQQFRFSTPFVVCFHKNESFIILREEGDGVLFLLNNRNENSGNALTLSCIGSFSLKDGFCYQLVFNTIRGSSMSFNSFAKGVKGQAEALIAATSTDFLFVPSDFSPEQLKLDVYIFGG